MTRHIVAVVALAAGLVWAVRMLVGRPAVGEATIGAGRLPDRA